MVGIDSKNRIILNSRFICPKCHLIIQDPIQLVQCGHRLCESCINTQDGTTIKCPSCSEETLRTKLMVDRAFRREMQSLPIECLFCSKAGVLSEYERHVNHLHPNLHCDACGVQFDSMRKLNEHRVLRCQTITSDCPLKEYGCEEPIVRGDIIKEHYRSERHQEVLEKILRQMQLLKDTERKPLVTVNTDLAQSTSVIAVDPDISRLKEMVDATQVQINELSSLNNALLECQQNYPMHNLDFFQTDLSVEEANKLLNENINDMPVVSTDGTFTWRITNINQKMRDAQSERQTSIYSPLFYTSPTGYKFCLRLYLHGDGDARGTHISVFYVLLRGQYDSILKFPYNYKVTLCLLDQSGSQRNFIKSFRPDIKSDSFQRPRSTMNVASGIPKFCSLALIQQEGNPYVRDDTLYIRTMIDFIGIPHFVIPYALNLDPGLPTQMQQRMIRDEITRRAQ